MPAPPTFEVREVHERRRGLGDRLSRWAWGGFGLGSLLFGGGMLAFAGLGGPPPMPLVLALPILAGLFAIYAWPVLLLSGLFLGRERGLPGKKLRIDGANLIVEDDAGNRTTLEGPLRQGTVVRDGVVIEGAAGRELGAKMDPRAATALIDALDLEPEKRRFTFRWQNRVARIQSWLAGFFFFGFLGAIPMQLAHGDPGLIGLATGCSILLAPLFVTEICSRWWSRRELTVGLDGLEHVSRRGRALVRFTDLAGVRSEGTELVLELRDGREQRLLADPSDPDERAAIEARIREAMAVARAKTGDHSVAAALLDRAGRSLSDWRAAAARVLTAATGFRDAMVGPDDLGAVLDDATATAEQRVAAAIALAQHPDHRPRVRVAAETIASPKLRVALERAADGELDDGALESALAESEAQASRT